MVIGERETAVVTGASRGIGEAFARYLAGLGYNLILVARSYKRLAFIADELMRQHAIGVEVIQADLSDMLDIKRVEKRLACHSHIDFLVNNAGFGAAGTFTDSNLHVHQAMINLHVAACAHLVAAVLPGMISRRHGVIINVSSMAAFLPRPKKAMYCSTKAFLVTFSRAINDEVATHGVRVLALCPGYTRTHFNSSPGGKEGIVMQKLPRILCMSPEKVVRNAIKTLSKRSSVCVPGIANRMLLFITRTRIGQSLARHTLTRLEYGGDRSLP